jgi:hypothetical protein
MSPPAGSQDRAAPVVPSDASADQVDRLEAAAVDFETRFSRGGLAALLSEAEEAVAELAPGPADAAGRSNSAGHASDLSGHGLAREDGQRQQQQRQQPAGLSSVSSQGSLLAGWASPRNLHAEGPAIEAAHAPPSPGITSWLAQQADEEDHDVATEGASPASPSKHAMQVAPKQPGDPGESAEAAQPASPPEASATAALMEELATATAGADPGQLEAVGASSPVETQQAGMLVEHAGNPGHAADSPVIGVPHIASPHFPLPRAAALEAPAAGPVLVLQTLHDPAQGQPLGTPHSLHTRSLHASSCIRWEGRQE